MYVCMYVCMYVKSLLVLQNFITARKSGNISSHEKSFSVCEEMLPLFRAVLYIHIYMHVCTISRLAQMKILMISMDGELEEELNDSPKKDRKVIRGHWNAKVGRDRKAWKQSWEGFVMVREMNDEKDCLILKHITCISAIANFNKNLLENGRAYHQMVI